MAWVVHAAAASGPVGVIHLWGDALHLLTSAFWPGPGGLAPLAAVLTLLLLKSRQVETIGLAAPVVRVKFPGASSLTRGGHYAHLTGLLGMETFSWSIRQLFAALLTSAYGQLLVSKLILFLAMIGFGAWNLFLLKPRIAVDLPTANVAQKNAVRLLLRNVLWEIGLGTVVILIVGLLGTTPPPMH